MQTIRVLWIPADPLLPAQRREMIPDLDGLCELVGGPLELVGLINPIASLYCDEEGKLARKPLNQRATELVQRHNALFYDVIVGDAVVTGPPTASGVDTDCPAEYLERAE